jgi:hypothetical protein
VEANAAAARVDRSLAHLDRRQALRIEAELFRQPLGDVGKVIGLGELELEGVIAIGIENGDLMSSSAGPC